MPTLEDARKSARERWGRLTPYRIGYCVGLLGVQCENPYSKTGRGFFSYREGLWYGVERRREKAKEE